MRTIKAENPISNPKLIGNKIKFSDLEVPSSSFALMGKRGDSKWKNEFVSISLPNIYM